MSKVNRGVANFERYAGGIKLLLDNNRYIHFCFTDEIKYVLMQLQAVAPEEFDWSLNALGYNRSETYKPSHKPHRTKEN